MEHRYVIEIIKNSKGEYLQYYDKRWNSFLFLNMKMIGNHSNDDVKKDINEKLNISLNSIKAEFKFDKIHKKFSESAKKEKEYHHYFYDVDIQEFTEPMDQKEFNINDIEYKWFTIEELEENERIQKVNGDIVSFIKVGK